MDHSPGRSRWRHYRFRSVWDLDAPPGAVFAVLERAEEYPRWWRQVRQAAPETDDPAAGTARFRSVLPYDLVVTAREAERDAAAGVLRIRLSGDLDGWVRWTVTARGAGTRAVFDQEVELTWRLPLPVAVVCRPLFRANHRLMMRGGLRGLRARLAAGG
ncbi:MULTISPECIES: SRPBCC family protein [Streptomyces]|uniref:Polyketide cyclase n=1 Tax=Streptomyces lycii TaxID=2654337 RepID=A0ABQ7FJL7_9ACTN|nr:MULTISPECIES: SRPBCC family protein [Streptomyces]KAF4407422.1 polyketide cyclase [Streptomyces lycii]PGH51384.1 polyketide cyclase [Streptomyces sp. Ru87]